MATKNKSNNTKKSKDTAKLKAENEALKAKLAKLEKSKAHSDSSKTGFSWRSFGKWSSFSLAGAIFIVASIVFYVGLTILHTDRFMAVAEPLAKQPAVQAAIADKTTEALFNEVDVEQLAQTVLPDQVDFLAPTVATQIEKFANAEAKKIIASDTFQNAWNTTLRQTHERTISALKNYEGDGTINVNDIYGVVSQRLQDGKLSFLSGKQLPPKIGDITLIQADWLPTAHRIVSNFDTVRAITILLFFALLAVFIWLSRNRRKAVMQLSVMIASLSLVILLALRIAQNIAVSETAPQYQDAIKEIWQVFTQPFIIQLTSTIILSLGIFLVAWIGSNSKSAANVRSRIQAVFEGKLHEALLKNENSATKWIGRYQKHLLTALTVLYVVTLIIVTLNVANFLIISIVAIVIALAILTSSAKTK